MTAERSLRQHVYLVWLGDELKAIYADLKRADEARIEFDEAERLDFGPLALPSSVQSVEVK